ncbi:MAG: hypothetical protein J07HQW1_01295 [Haloquadratum walsbyi J07HQW1]|uniref:Uncharacterized protein n=1 Tax=Haloquadratum walsbyi J07HQW1 TaxID=1238424 RepID=U1PGK4_9EURY|nr:MAG: hypothetical protein J07HQW1_01295 [Haloquadratum walsbyi J07HQW1]
MFYVVNACLNLANRKTTAGNVGKVKERNEITHESGTRFKYGSTPSYESASLKY